MELKEGDNIIYKKVAKVPRCKNCRYGDDDKRTAIRVKDEDMVMINVVCPNNQCMRGYDVTDNPENPLNIILDALA